METLFNAVLVVHVAGGMAAFVAAPAALAVKKGGRNHRRAGRLFFRGMTAVCATGFALSVLHPNVFLFAVSGFSYYMVASGYRWTRRKAGRPAAIDKFIAGAAAVFNLFLFGLGAWLIAGEPGHAFGYIAAVFGLIGTLLVISDIRTLRNPPKEKYAWMLHHMGGMIGGYIATVSAFSAVNFNFLPTLVQWLWPTVLGVPLLMVTVRAWRRKFEREGQGMPAADKLPR